ncbi:MAG: UPF0182 family protein [Hadesarchaea archaeon]|nr:UPF0182 family protein [Hadesarchaea archaeon]
MFFDRGQSLEKWFLYGVIGIVALMIIISVSSSFIMDYYWFSAVGYLEVFMINVKYQLALLFLGWVITSVLLLLSWRTISNSLGNQIPDIGGRVYKFISVIAGFGVGWWLKEEYLVFLKFLNQASWGVTDPVFGNDISFYVFTLPVIRLILIFIGVVGGVLLLFTIFSYGVGRLSIEAKIEKASETPPDLWSASRFVKSWPVLKTILALVGVGAVWVWLGRFSYLWEFEAGASVPIGASYMAVNYFIPYAWIKALGVILFGVLVYRVFTRSEEIRDGLELGDFSKLSKEAGLFIGVVIILVLIPGLVFGAIDTLEVSPNEPGVQEKYINRGIEYTNQAYDLDNIARVTYPVSSENLSLNEALSSPTVQNARIVDYRPIKTTYEEKQRLRTYYEFHDVDVDRYDVENSKTLAVISGREMDKEGGGWQNQHLFYTHGFGVVVSPANDKESDGSPILSIRDIPPVSDWEETEILEPRIYFGERTNDYAVVRASGLKEFDYPKGDNNVQYTYEWDKGINLGDLWKNLVSWFYTGDFKLMVSDYVGENSRLLLHRNVHDRVSKIAPFLNYDPNAQLFINDQGGLNYLLNGISWAKKYPYSYSDSNAPGYLSDSVKAFVKTNTGDVEFYKIDENDPVAQTFSNIYPNLLKDESELPQDYRKHLIYPPSLFETQMSIYRRYHMTDYQSFYQKEDLWTPAQEIYHGRSKRLEAYNILLDVTEKPGFENNNDEFTLVKPFTPKDKRNMRAWVGVAQDPNNYGEKIAIEFPKGQQAIGPMQVEAIIDQDPRISEQFTLWDRAGSQVLRGNLLVLPVKNDVLYIEPVYLSAETTAYPQLKRIIAAYGDRAVMDNTLQGAITKVLKGEKDGEGPIIPGENLAPAELVQIVQEYTTLWEEYTTLISQGEYAQAGQIQENMANLIENMKKHT